MTVRPEATTPQRPKAEKPNLWVGPLFFLLILLVPTLILIFSNTESAQLDFAGWHWSAPLWVILLATFAAGMLFTRLFGWVWQAFRRSRARVKALTRIKSEVSST